MKISTTDQLEHLMALLSVKIQTDIGGFEKTTGMTVSEISLSHHQDEQSGFVQVSNVEIEIRRAKV